MSIQDKLSRFKEGEGSGEKSTLWTPPGLSDMATCYILALDQTLSNTGYVNFRISLFGDDGPSVEVIKKGVIKPTTELKSFHGNFEKGNILAEEFSSLLCYTPCKIVLYEMPAVVGHRTDSSLLAAFAIQREADRHKIPAKMISAQHVRRALGGPGCKDKKALKDALKVYLEDSSSRGWNEHTRDALGIGLTGALELKGDPNFY